MNLNRIILIGRLTADPTERVTQDGTETSSFRLAVSRSGKPREGEPDADFFAVTAWRNTARFVNQYMRRGNLVAVEGKVQLDEWTDREGKPRAGMKVLADNVQSLQTRAETEAQCGEREQRRTEAPPRGMRPRPDQFDDQPAPARGGARPAARAFDDDTDDPFADH
jgi:single-strand DNA-binding protein